MKFPGIALVVFGVFLLSISTQSRIANGLHVKSANTSKAEVKALYDQWSKAFETHDIDGIMTS
jgi:hypothetical protein